MGIKYSGTESNIEVSLHQELFTPIDLDWRKKYYRKLLKKRLIAFLLDLWYTYLSFNIISFFIVFFILANSVSQNLDSQIRDFFGIDDYDFFETILLYSIFIIFIIGFISPFLQAWMESSKSSGTFGKRKMKIEITDDYGNSITFWRSLLRNFLKFLFFLSYMLILPAVIQIFTYRKTKKLFHDQLSHTIIGERLK